jgi:hypothetical protein
LQTLIIRLAILKIHSQLMEYPPAIFVDRSVKLSSSPASSARIVPPSLGRTKSVHPEMEQTTKDSNDLGAGFFDDSSEDKMPTSALPSPTERRTTEARRGPSPKVNDSKGLGLRLEHPEKQGWYFMSPQLIFLH